MGINPSEWLVKFVADVAAFDKKTGKVDSPAEKKVLSGLLANLDKPEDKDYVQKIMDGEKIIQVNGKNPEKNTERRAEMEIDQSKMPENAINPPKTSTLFFDEQGNLRKSVHRDVDGKVISITDLKLEGDLVYGKDSLNNLEYVLDVKTGEMIQSITRDAEDNIISMTKITPNGHINIYNTPDGNKHYNTYNNNSKIYTERIVDPQGELLEEFDYKTDENGMMIERNVIFSRNYPQPTYNEGPKMPKQEE